MTTEPHHRTQERLEHRFTLLPAGTPLPPMAQVTSVSVVAFDSEGHIVVARLSHRGLDLPGGHIEPQDTDIEAAARRETIEEVCVTLRNLKLACIIESSMQHDGKPTYMVIMAACIDEILPLQFAEGEESQERLFLSPDVFLAQHRGFALMPAIIARAREIYTHELAPEHHAFAHDPTQTMLHL